MSEGRAGCLALAVLAVAAALPAPSAAESALAIELETRTTSSAGVAVPGAPVQRARLWLQGRRLRAESEAAPGTVVLFDGEQSALWTLEPATGRATLLDDETVGELRERIAAARERLESHVASLPPADRARTRPALDRHPLMQPPTPAAGPTLAAPEGSDQVDGRGCRIQALLQDGAEAGDVCVVGWAEAGATREDLVALSELRAFQEKVHAVLGTGPAPALPGPALFLERLAGYPVRVRSPLPDGRVRETRLSLPDRRAPEPGTFELPEGVEVRKIRVPTSAVAPEAAR